MLFRKGYGKPLVTDPSAAAMQALLSPVFCNNCRCNLLGDEFLQVLRSTCTVAAQGRFVENLTIKQMSQRRKYECLYQFSFENGFQAKTGIGNLIAHDNAKRFKSIHGILPPIAAYAPKANPVGISA